MSDPRVRLRDALREVVLEDPTGWSRPSLDVFRNRLMDRTGSDYRPYAELLAEAARRGWCERLAQARPGDPRWEGLLHPFVMHWSAERFVQPEMARWAAESWGVALGVIDVQRVQVAPPPAPPPPMVAGAEGAGGRARPATPGGAPPVRRGGTALPGTMPSATAAASGRRPWRAPATRLSPAPPATSGAMPATYRPPGYRAGLLRGAAPVNPRVTRSLALAVGGLMVAFGIQVAGTPTEAPPRTAPPAAAAPSRASATAALTAAAPSAAPAGNDTVTPRLARGPEGGGGPAASLLAEANPGVPSLTGTLLPTAADSGRLLVVQPARRASGEGRRLSVAPAGVSAAYDELHLTDGSVLRGTVEVVRAGSVLFRDRGTGLRHEVRKETVDRIITEFGSTVRFRAAGSSATAEARRTAAASSNRRRIAERGSADTPRGRGVGGRYVIRFAEARVEGSAACREAWTRRAGAEERAVVWHAPGADTLVLAFEGGDQFPSNIDPDGYFASTFRIVPDQARSSTALTTRLTGRFEPAGGLAVTVNIVFFRRLRTGEDLSCAVAIPGRGERAPSAVTPQSRAPNAPRRR